MAFAHLSCEQLSNWLATQANEIAIIDIRDRASYLNGHITGATHIDNSNVDAFISETPSNTPVVVCCYHGNSSQGAANFLNEQGFSQTYSLDGGFEEWQRTEYIKQQTSDNNSDVKC